MRSVFISYKYEDKRDFDQLKKWETNGRLGNVRLTGETKDVRSQGEQAIQNHLNPKIDGASVVLILVGNDTHSSRWVEHEVERAEFRNKKIIVVRIKETLGGAPKLLRNIPEVHFEANAIRNAIQ